MRLTRLSLCSRVQRAHIELEKQPKLMTVLHLIGVLLNGSMLLEMGWQVSPPAGSGHEWEEEDNPTSSEGRWHLSLLEVGVWPLLL